MTVLSDFW